MGLFSFNRARRRSMIKEDNVFSDIEKGRIVRGEIRTSAQKVQPSFSGGMQSKAKVKDIIKEKKLKAEKRYEEALATGKDEKEAYKELQSARLTEKKYKQLKKEQRERKLAPIRKGFGVLQQFGKNVALKQRKGAAKGVFKGFGQQSNVEFGSEVVNSPFAPKR